MSETADGLQPFVLRALEREGFDGLYNDGADCACRLDDLMPCDGPSMDCCPGYLQPLTAEERAEWDFRLGPTRHPTPGELEAAGQQRLFSAAEDDDADETASQQQYFDEALAMTLDVLGCAPDNPYPTPIVE